MKFVMQYPRINEGAQVSKVYYEASCHYGRTTLLWSVDKPVVLPNAAPTAFHRLHFDTFPSLAGSGRQDGQPRRRRDLYVVL